MKQILIFGAGKSATCLIEYLIREAASHDWQITVADSNPDLARSKTGDAPHTQVAAIDVTDPHTRKTLVEAADLVISMLPPALHALIARDCVDAGRHLLTASYVDDAIRALEPQIRAKNLLFLCEMGLDPGIDHMSALQLIHRVQAAGGTITDFLSHCGGLIAPENDDNPWRYKITWNPRNVVLAGKGGAVFKENGAIKTLPYEQLFDPKRVVKIPELDYLAWYPNRDSLPYIALYGLDQVRTFVRTTLRYPEFCFGWKNVVDLRLTDETAVYDTNGMSLRQFFQQHFNQHGFSQWIEKQLTARFTQTKQLLEKLQQLLEAEEEANEEERKELQDFMVVDDQGDLVDVNLDEVKTQAAATVAGQMHEANLTMKQLVWLGMDDDDTLINKGRCSAADILQFAVEKKMALGPADRDMIVMLHQVGYRLNGRDCTTDSCLIVKGDNNLRTAMAKTVGLPLGIAAKLILEGKIQLTGLQIPVSPDIYEPVLEELATFGIRFTETTGE